MISMQHIALNCRSIARQEQFYTRYFGFRRARVFNEGRPDEVIMLRLGDFCLELFATPGKTEANIGGEQPVGFKHLAFEVLDLDTTLSGLRAEGIKTGSIINGFTAIQGFRICFFKDPDGNCLELMQGYKDSS